MSQKQKLLLTICLVLIAALVAVAFLRRPKTQPKSETFFPKAGEADTPKTTAPPANPPAKQPSLPAQTTSDGISIDSPTQGSKVMAGTMVSGKAHVSGAKIGWSLKSQQKGLLASSSMDLPGSDTTSKPFSFELDFEKQPGGGDSGVLEVFSFSADGSETNVSSVGVVF